MNTETSDNTQHETCFLIPVQQVPSIQSFGVLIAVEKESQKISHVSENIERAFGVPLDKILGNSIFSFDKQPQFKQIAEMIRTLPMNNQYVEAISCNEYRELFCHQQEKHYIFEWIFFHKEEEVLVLDRFQRVAVLFDQIRKHKIEEEMLQQVCEKLKDIFSFDKVMIYSFRPDGSGDVVAQARETEMDDYIGLRFPFSDVPPQVREVYLKNPIRLIQNVWHQPVAIRSLNGQPILDLTYCILKGVASVHQEYVQNMKIATSISHSITVRGELWGLLCFHQMNPKELPHQNRILVSLVAQLLELSIDLLEKEKGISFEKQTRDILYQMTTDYAYTKHKFIDIFLDSSERFLKLVQADGCCISFNGEIKTKGNVPPMPFIQELINWIYIDPFKKEIFSTNCLLEVFPSAKEFKAIASGIMAYNIGPQKNDMIIWFRPEQITHIRWGGNPNLNVDTEGKIHPKNSFALWSEAVSGKSMQWLPREVKLVKDIQDYMRKVILELLLQKIKEN